MASDAVAEIKARLDIVDVIGSYVSLVRSGRSFKALCPFHSEKTPSFTVSQERQAWYCFGCSEGGDVFSFVERIERSDFLSALRLLAERAGVELEERSPGKERGAASRRRRTLELNGKAQAYFEHVLWETTAGEAGRNLLEGRGVNSALARTFGVGFAPAGGRGEDALVRYLVGRGASLDEVVDAGLAHHSRGGGGRDRFRHRLIFPIRDERGQAIAFGARALGDDQPKYLNSPETAVYHKSSALFGLDLAKDAVRESGSALIVEGYFDVVAAQAAGVANVVASSGTALNREQVHLLSRYARSVALCFDADDAGTAAASRAVDVVAAEGLAARIVVMPPGFKDPDELVRRDLARFIEAVAQAPPEWQVLLDRALADGEGGSVESRRGAAERAVALLTRIPEAATRDLYIQQAASRLGLSPRSLLADVGRAKREAPRRPARVVAVAPEVPEHEVAEDAAIAMPEPKSWERLIAAAVVLRPALARTLVGEMGMGVTELAHEGVRRLVEVALELPDGASLPLHSLGAAERTLASRLLLAPPPELDEAGDQTALTRSLADAVSWVREAGIRTELAAVKRDLRIARDAGREDDVARLAARLAQLAATVPRLRRSVDQP